MAVAVNLEESTMNFKHGCIYEVLIRPFSYSDLTYETVVPAVKQLGTIFSSEPEEFVPLRSAVLC